MGNNDWVTFWYLQIIHTPYSELFWTYLTHTAGFWLPYRALYQTWKVMGGPQKEPSIISSPLPLSPSTCPYRRKEKQVLEECRTKWEESSLLVREEQSVQPVGEGRAKILATERPNACKLLTPVPGMVNTMVFVIIIIKKPKHYPRLIYLQQISKREVNRSMI